MTSNQLTEQQIDLLIENGYDIAHTLENLAENEINSDCFEVFSYSENGRETEWNGKITEFAQRAAKAIRHLTDATTALQAELQERRKADREPVAWTWQHLKQWHVTNDEERARDLAWDGVKVDPLYRHAQPAPVVPDGYVMVPMRLTAENGAKGALSGEFSETKFVNCPECFGDDECETCDGSGRIEITVPVTWTTIKEIWAKGVEHFAAAPQEVSDA